VLAAKVGRLTPRLHVQYEIDIALLVPQHVLGPVPRHGGEPHGFEDLRQRLGIRAGELDELEPVGTERIFVEIVRHERSSATRRTGATPWSLH
jgi:hypothetical protein